MAGSKSKTTACAGDNIRINTLCPGFVQTPRLDAANVGENQQFQELVASIPLVRIARPEEIAAVAAFLASPMASYVTGTTLAVDGGSNKSLA